MNAETGPNGVEVTWTDVSEPYGYENLYRVALRVEARVPGCDEPYTRTLERMGVGTDELDAVRRELADGFRTNVLPYLFRADFPERYRARLERSARPSRVVPYRGAT